MTKDTEAGTTIGATETAFDIVEYTKDNSPVGVTELATELEYAKSTIHKHIKTLEQRGYLRKDGNRYKVGLRFLDLGVHARNELPLFDVGRTQIDAVAKETGEKCWLIGEEHGYGIHLYGSTGSSPLRTYARVGKLTYLHQTAAGKAILAHLPDNRIETVVATRGLPAKTPETITSQDSLWADINEIRDKGYALNLEETVPGLNAVGVPITDSDGNAIAGLSVSGPAKRLTGELLTEELPSLLLGVANEIEINLVHERQAQVR